jgi:hypothetical protein
MDLATRSSQLLTKLQRLRSEMEPGVWPDSGLLFQYLRHLKRKSYYPKLILLGVTTGCAVASVLWNKPVILGFASIPLFTFALITLRESVTAYKLSSAIPETESEIQDLLKFILDHPIDIELTDPISKPRPSAVTEPTHRGVPAFTQDGAVPE